MQQCLNINDTSAADLRQGLGVNCCCRG